ncbi:hypothetical protein GWK47_041377 [Chionoecetes opilio]|uniref:Transposase n=1 Tax=Chionoecetes opilio TaxID=41210 RepID=A0A8J4YP25_CHIOP|nr:hypothetical protein GWK47_041377 [Chionoecetes opilio]
MSRSNVVGCGHPEDRERRCSLFTGVRPIFFSLHIPVSFEQGKPDLHHSAEAPMGCLLVAPPTISPCVVDMGKNKHFSAEIIAQIIALNKSGKQTKAISKKNGVCPRSVRSWVAKFDQEGGHTTPTHKKRPGQPKKTDSRSQTIVKRELESNPRVTARKLKESNPDIFGECSCG